MSSSTSRIFVGARKGTGFPATREVASAKKSSARKNNTLDKVIMFGGWKCVVTEASSGVWQGNQHFYTSPAWLQTTFAGRIDYHDDGTTSEGVSKDEAKLNIRPES